MGDNNQVARKARKKLIVIFMIGLAVIHDFNRFMKLFNIRKYGLAQVVMHCDS